MSNTVTWDVLQKLTGAFLSGDNTMASDETVRLILLEEALHIVASKAETLTLETTDEALYVLRQGSAGDDNVFIRIPETPVDGNSIIDIDRLLIPAVARYMASFVSREKMEWHEKKAEDIINIFNNKVYHYRDNN